MKPEREELKERLDQLNDEVLLEIINSKPGVYTEEAIKVAKAILGERAKIESKHKISQDIKQNEIEEILLTLMSGRKIRARRTYGEGVSIELPFRSGKQTFGLILLGFILAIVLCMIIKPEGQNENASTILAFIYLSIILIVPIILFKIVPPSLKTFFISAYELSRTNISTQQTLTITFHFDIALTKIYSLKIKPDSSSEIFLSWIHSTINTDSRKKSLQVREYLLKLASLSPVGLPTFAEESPLFLIEKIKFDKFAFPGSKQMIGMGRVWCFQAGFIIEGYITKGGLPIWFLYMLAALPAASIVGIPVTAILFSSICKLFKNHHIIVISKDDILTWEFLSGEYFIKLKNNYIHFEIESRKDYETFGFYLRKFLQPKRWDDLDSLFEKPAVVANNRLDINDKLLCLLCKNFDDSYGVCSYLHFNVRSYPKQFFKKCDGKYFSEKIS